VPSTRTSRSRPSVELRTTAARVGAFRRARHHLLSRAPARALATVLDDIAGAQSQLLTAAEVSVGARVEGIRPSDFERALDRDRTLSRAWCMRRTVYLLPSTELAVYVRGTARRVDREITWLVGKGLPQADLEPLVDAVLSALDRPITRSELCARVAATLDLKPARHRGGGWGNERDLAGVAVGELVLPGYYLLHLAGIRGVVCSGPRSGNEATFVRADAWVPDWRDLPPERAEEELLRRYLRAFGPAVPEDFAWWTGLRLRDVLRIWGRVESELAAVDVDGKDGWLRRVDLDDLRTATADRTTVRLLPYFDSFLLGHRDDRHAVPAARWDDIYRPQGWVAPIVLEGDRAIGTWTHERRGGRVEVRVTPFARVAPGVAARMRAEGRELAEFLGSRECQVTIEAAARETPPRSTGARRKRGTG
jgi:Winged helix DNA-binding domain